MFNTSNLSIQVRQVVMLYATTILSVLIGVLNSVINTRSLVPELYGDVRYVQNIISFISSLLLVGFFVSGSRLLAISKDEQYSRRLRGILCVILAVTIFILMLCMFGFYIASMINGNENVQSLWLVSIPICGSVLMLNYINTTAQGDNHIGRIAIARLLPSALYCTIAWFVYRRFEATPVLMLILYNGIATLILIWVILSTRPSFVGLKESFRILKEENKQYGFNVYLGSVIGVSTGYIAGITLGYFCEDNSNVGFYTLALTISSPLSMLPAIVGTTFFKRFANENCINRKVMISSIGLTTLSCLFYIIFIDFVVDFLYDDNYRSVSTYAQWMAIGCSLHGLGDMINRFLGAHGQGRQIRNSAIVCGTIKTFGSIVFVYMWQIYGAVFSAILGSTAYFICLLIYYLKYVRTIKLL